MGTTTPLPLMGAMKRWENWSGGPTSSGCESSSTSSWPAWSTAGRYAQRYGASKKAGSSTRRRPTSATSSPTPPRAMRRCNGRGASTSSTSRRTGSTARPRSTRSRTPTPTGSSAYSSGELTGIYHEAFDFANEEWQEWFCGKALGLIERFSIDGFRFDVPTYNTFANWSKTRRERASASTLGCISLFERLRRADQGQVSAGADVHRAVWRVASRSMDMNYNYDELWLVPALYGDDPRSGRGGGSGKQLARWLEERDATLPADAWTAHHLDSHDTFWWPAPGRKWRREPGRSGVPATRALMWCLALCGGPYMMFVGGESGMEEDLRRTMTLRVSVPSCGTEPPTTRACRSRTRRSSPSSATPRRRSPRSCSSTSPAPGGLGLPPGRWLAGHEL